MKKLIVLFLLIVPLFCNAQNLQLHYDFGDERKYFTTTHEMFRPDSLGSTFWFIDFDFNFPGSTRSMSAAYWEIAREFYIPGLRKLKAFDELTLHLEYNDGFTAFETSPDTMGAASYNSIFLTGFSHPLKLGSFVLTTQWLLRFPRGMRSPDFQFTLVWFQPVFNGKVLITGYSDLASQDKIFGTEKELVFQTEPQFWYMIHPKFALGGEIEISKNFPYGPTGWEFKPTLGVRWEF